MPQISPEDVLQKVAEAATDSAAKQYDDYSKTFVALDGKAQAASTAGSVLLGVIVALTNAGKLNVLIKDSAWYLLLLALPVLAALCAMLLGFKASRVAQVNVPFDADQQIKEFNNLYAVTSRDEIDQENLIGFHAGRHRQWQISLGNMAEAVANKGKLVGWAQAATLACAVLTVVVLMVAAIRAV